MINWFLRNKKVLLISGLILGAFFVSTTTTFAATKYWIGADGASISVASNWTLSPTGCTGTSAGVPTASDIATFGTSCTHSALIDVAWTLSGLAVNSGYTGTITQNANVIVAAAGFSQVYGTWVLTSGTVTLGGGALSCSGTFAGNILINNTATISAGCTVNFGNNSNSITYGQLTNNGNMIFGTGTTTVGMNILNYGTITVNGSVWNGANNDIT